MLLGWAEESRLLRWLGLGHARHVCDLGCGPGYVAAHIARDFAPARITGIDEDHELLAFARAASIPGFHAVGGDLRACPLAGGSVDFVIARHVVQHLEDPGALAREAYRLLAPGGTMVVIDVDAELWGLTSPPLPPLDASEDRTAAGPGGRLVGRRLHKLLEAAGFEDVHLDAVVYHSDAHGLDAFRPHLDPARFTPLLRAGTVTGASATRFQQAHDVFTRDANGFALLVEFVASGRTPGQPRGRQEAGTST